MKKLILLVCALLLFGLVSCSTDFWDGFNEGFNATYQSYEGPTNLPPNYQPYEYRLTSHSRIP